MVLHSVLLWLSLVVVLQTCGSLRNVVSLWLVSILIRSLYAVIADPSLLAFSAAPFLGPAIGPLAGGYLADAKGWRWLYWIQLIIAGAAYLLIVITVPETYAPKILKSRAKKMRKETGDASFVCEMDLDQRPFAQRMKIFMLRPFQLLFSELIVFLISIYMSVLYALLYMFFVA